MKLFTSATHTALKNLKHHITTGCPSNIPPAMGTRNGILLTYAIFTMIINAHNSLTYTTDVESLSLKLQEMFVKEFLGEHHGNELLSLCRFYTSSVGDLMPLAMATFSEASVVTITMDPQRHPMYVTPLIGSAEQTIFLT